MRKLLVASVVFLVLLFSRCAQTAPLTGGVPDRIPPEIVSTEPVSNTVNFNSATVTIQFNEHIQVLDAANQIKFSPQINELPDLTVKGKTLLVNLSKSKLLPNTTYRIDFGNAIADITERNTAKNIHYVFSTGPYLDSLKLSGRVISAEDNSPLTNVLVGLYLPEINNDSLAFNATPLFIANTDNSGAFDFAQLPIKSFQVFAIADKNKNQRYDGDQEKIGFLATSLNMQQDTVLTLKVFSEPPAKTFISQNKAINYGKHFISLNKKTSWQLQPLDVNLAGNVYVENRDGVNDSIFVYYHHLNDTLALVSGAPDKTADTVYLKLPRFKPKALAAPELISPLNLPAKTDRILLRFSTWMDTSKTAYNLLAIKSTVDTSFKKLSGYWINIHDFALNVTFVPGATYTVQIPKTTFVDMQKNSNDSLSLKFSLKQSSDFGNLNLTLKLKQKQQYLVQLLNEQKKVTAQKKIYLSLSASNATELDFTGIPPGSYRVKIIYDNNENEQWDSGNYLKKIQPERVEIFEKDIKILPEWDTIEVLEEK